jgi:hypothetical protein
MRETTAGGEPEVGCCAGGFIGAIIGAVFGIALAIGLFVTCLASGSDSDFGMMVFSILEILVIVVGTGSGVFIGIKMARGRVRADSSVPPNVEEAARTHFTPSTPSTPSTPPVTEDRIKQPDEPNPDTTDPAP